MEQSALALTSSPPPPPAPPVPAPPVPPLVAPPAPPVPPLVAPPVPAPPLPVTLAELVVLLVVEMTLASARDAIRILSWLKANAGHIQPIIVANKVQAGVAEISKADFEASIERKIGFTIPYDIKAAANAAKLGQTFADANRSAKAGSVIRDISKAVMGVGEGETVENVVKAKSSLLGKLDLKALMPKKDKSKQPAMAKA